MQILIAFKQASLAPYQKALANEAGATITDVDTAEESLEYALSYEYDSIVFDYALCEQEFGDFIQKLRTKNCVAPIITMVGDKKISTLHVTELLDGGCDDVIYTLIAPEEFMARVRALVRRNHGFSHPIIIVGNINIDLQNHQVAVGQQQIDLTNKEQAIMECLALNKDRVLSKEALLSYVYGGMDEPEIRIIDAFIWRIRKKLNDAGQENDYMQTIWGRGYRLSDNTLPV